MKLFLLAFVLSVVALSSRAQATVCTIPNTITNGALVDATPVQQNFNALVSCANNIDWSNIDSSGIYASQIIPISPGTATFGSGQDYTFQNHLIVLDGVVVDSTAVPTSGVAGGNSGVAFRFWSNSGSSAESSFHFVTSTAVPSSAPVFMVANPGNSFTYFEISSVGDGTFAGGLSIDGTQPDGSSIIGGGTAPSGSPVPLWFISKAGVSAKSNFAFLDNKDSIPAIVVENSGAGIIFQVDGSGNAQGKTFAADSNTPPPHGYAGGVGTNPFTLTSDTVNASAFAFQDIGGNNNLARFYNSSGNTVTLIDEAGGITIGASSQTDVEPTSASFGGSVTIPTIAPNSVACTNGASSLITCAGGQFGIPIYYEGGGGIGGSNPHITINDNPVCVSYSGNTLGTTAVTFSGKAQFPGNNYSVTYSVQNVSGSTPPVVVLEAQSPSATGFTVTGYGNGGSGSGNICVNYIAVGD